MRNRWLVIVWTLTVLLVPVGCRQTGGIVLYDVNKGDQWVWPYFASTQPTVLAFWNTEELRCIEDLSGINTLDKMGVLHLVVSVCVSDDEVRIRKYCSQQGVEFPVLPDPEGRLARRLGVSAYPTYILFDKNGKEVERSTTIRTIDRWFEDEEYIRRVTHRAG